MSSNIIPKRNNRNKSQHAIAQDVVKRHVFLIDDDQLIRENLSTTLRDEGYEVQTFANPTEFLHADFSLFPAIILSDMVMPLMTGIELQAELNNRNSFIPFVLMSGESSVAQSVTAMKQGAIEFLVKPFEKRQLMEAIARGHDMHARQMHLSALLAKLTLRERQVFGLMVDGHANASLVEAMGISLPTAKQYKSEVMRKLGVKSLADLLLLVK